MSPFWLIFLNMVNLNNCIYFWRSRVSKIPYIHRGQFFWGYRRAINAVKLIKLRCFYNRQNDIIAHNVVQDYGVDFKINKMEVIWSHHQLPFCDSQEYLKNLFKMVLDLSYQNMDSFFFFFLHASVHVSLHLRKLQKYAGYFMEKKNIFYLLNDLEFPHNKWTLKPTFHWKE